MTVISLSTSIANTVKENRRASQGFTILKALLQYMLYEVSLKTFLILPHPSKEIDTPDQNCLVVSS